MFVIVSSKISANIIEALTYERACSTNFTPIRFICSY